MKITLYCFDDRDILEEFIVKSGEIKNIHVPLIMIKLYKKNFFHFKIERNVAVSWFYNFFDTYNTEFIYGYVVPELRTELVNTNLFYINDKLILLYYQGQTASWLYLLCYSYPELVNQEFYHNYMNNIYKDFEEIFTEFKNKHPEWIEILHSYN